MKTKIIDTSWFHLGKWPEPTFAADTWLAYGHTAQQFFSQPLDNKILFLTGDFFLSQHDSDIFVNEAYEAAKRNDKEFFNLIYNTVIAVSSGLQKNVHTVTNDTLIDFLDTYQQLTGVWMPLNNVAIGIEKYVSQTNPGALDISKGFFDIKPLTLQQVDELKEIKNLKDFATDITNVLQDHVNKYAWLGSHHFTVRQFTVNEAIGRMDTLAEVDAKNGSVHDGGFCVWLLDLIAAARFIAAETSGYVTYYLKPTLSALATKYNLSYDELMELTLDELKSGAIDKNTINERMQKIGLYYDGTSRFVLSQNDHDKILKKLVSSDTTDNIVRGIIAQKGTATGIVKHVYNAADQEDFNEGDILVAYETTPDIIFAMQKAGAIVTDFGGLTCHAAIVARELKKPCVVGTKNATKVLKNGDKVMVDANTGIVTIL